MPTKRKMAPNPRHRPLAPRSSTPAAADEDGAAGSSPPKADAGARRRDQPASADYRAPSPAATTGVVGLSRRRSTVGVPIGTSRSLIPPPRPLLPSTSNHPEAIRFMESSNQSDISLANAAGAQDLAGSYTADHEAVRDSSDRLAFFALSSTNDAPVDLPRSSSPTALIRRGAAAGASGFSEPKLARVRPDAPESRSSAQTLPSGLPGLLRQREDRADPGGDGSAGSDSAGDVPATERPTEVDERASALAPVARVGHQATHPTERENLLEHGPQYQRREGYGSVPSAVPAKHPLSPSPSEASFSPSRLLARSRKALKRSVAQLGDPRRARELAVSPLYALPSVLLGVLMNVLDGVSYGLIIFPASVPAFGSGFGGIGVSMFFITCVVSQLVYGLGGSAFRGGNGSMMVECVPFMHVIAQTVAAEIGANNEAVVATTLLAYALGSILTGAVFYALGHLKLGGLMGFFPRHILVGAIGAVGVFLFLTGLEVTARLEGDFSFDLKTLKLYFSGRIAALWTLPLALAVLLRLVTARYSHPFIVPAYFLMVPVAFYIFVFALHGNLESLREEGWIFEIEGVDNQPFEYLELFNFGKVDWEALGATIPTQLALVAFGLIHVPINLPSLALSLNFDNLDIDRELKAHGYSNALAGLAGSVPNYLCYVNSVLFVRVGGDSRVASFMLAGATFAVFLVGPWVIGYLPVCVVGALIFVLGMDLIKEALWDTWGRVNNFEYATICAIIIASTASDFVIGLLVGIVCACVSFAVTSSQRRAIRTIMSGSTARSTVRRHPKQNAFLTSVGSQTRILKLQGHLFFGTISACEKTIRDILDAAAWTEAPIRFLIFDFTDAVGVDFSAAEAFLRLQRVLAQKDVVFVIAGADEHGAIGKALRNVNLWCGQEDMRVEVFEYLNEALEHCENAYLRSLYTRDLQPVLKPPASNWDVAQARDLPLAIDDNNSSLFTLSSSPRRVHLKHAAHETLGSAASEPQNASRAASNLVQPLPLLLQTFKPFLPELTVEFWFGVAPYFERVCLEADQVLWRRDDEADCFYIIESGILRAQYVWPAPTPSGPLLCAPSRHTVLESMVAGTCSGEHTFLSATPRNTDVAVEKHCILWKMDRARWERLVKELGPEVRETVAKGLLRMAGEEQDVLISHLFTTIG